jgi:NitT/TauT family transport system permease protein
MTAINNQTVSHPCEQAGCTKSGTTTAMATDRKAAIGWAPSVEGMQAILISSLSLVVFFVGWEAIIRVLDVSPYIFPAPSSVLSALWYDLRNPDYWLAVGVTLTEILLGFAVGSILGIALGTALALSPVMDRIFYPYIVAFQSVPKVAVAPLMVVWFGFGMTSKFLIVALTAMFPVLVNTIAGLRSTDADRLDLLRGLCATRRQSLRYLRFPQALPYIFAGLNTAIVFAVIGAIVGEFVGARQGLGVVILKANFALDLASVFSSLIVLGVIGVTLNAAVRAIEQRACFWSGKKRA